MVSGANTQREIKRRFYVSMLGSLNQLAMGGSEGGCWSTQNGKMAEILNVHMEGCDPQSSVSILSQAVLKMATIIEYTSTLPCAVGVNISCVPSSEVMKNGTAFAFVALPGSTNTTPLCIYENDATTAESMAWRLQYPEYNALNLETHGVLNVQGEGFMFVSKTHPVIDLLRANKDVLRADIDKQTLIDDQWLKVTKQVMSTCCQQIKVKVLNRVGTVDLSNISVQMTRIDASWNSLAENDGLWATIPQELIKGDEPVATDSSADHDAAQKAKQQKFQQYVSDMMSKRHQFHCRLELTFELLPINLAP